MCGIAGIVRDKRSGTVEIERMVEALGHRGPDDKGIANCAMRIAEALTASRKLQVESQQRDAEGGTQRTGDRDRPSKTAEGQFEITFGHTRLAIIDLSSAGHQPKVTSDGRYTIVY